MSEPDPEWPSVYPKVESNTTLPTDIVQFRKEANQERKAFDDSLGPVVTDGLKVENWHNTVEDRVLAVRTYVPHTNSALGETESHRFPVLVWMYGGGFCIGTLDDDDRALREWTVEFRMVCVGIDYRKAPEHPFPAAYNDAYAGLQWTVANAHAISADLNKGLIVGGISAGGNLAAAIAQTAARDPTFQGKVTGQILIVPAIVFPMAYPEKYKSELLSLEQNADAPVLTKEKTEFYLKCYAPTPALAADPRASPGLASSLVGLPPAYIQAAGLDPVRDDAFLYARLLLEAGVPTKIDGYPGVPHGFHVFFPDMKASHKQKADFKAAVRWLLSGVNASK
ncbi:Alpha/Beta hydrolase protein [Hysterangium stoloniferum]|nr:Alpha/Beta hydrolase protein [Hysterangium stoloniferum]